MAGTIFSVCTISAKTFNLKSGTSTTPTLGSMVQNGYGAQLAICLESKALKSVDLPALGSPTIPILKLMAKL